MKQNAQFLFIAWSVLFLFPMASLFAAITNESNGNIQIEITKESGDPNRLTMYPGQSTEIPIGATQITVVSSHFGRGDEVVKIKIVENEGLTGYITKTNMPYILGREDVSEEDKAAYKSIRATNQSNVPLDLAVTKKNGNTTILKILPAQSMNLPEDTAEVKVTPSTSLRGDENIKLEMRMLNGEVKKLNRFGEKIALENKKA